MALPVKAVVVLAVAVLVLAALLAYFLLAGGGFFERSQLERRFTEGCISVCQQPNRMTMNLAVRYPDWLRACESLHGVPRGAYLQCVELCGCSVPQSPCDYLRSFRPVIDDWLSFCTRVRTHEATQPTYGNCTC